MRAFSSNPAIPDCPPDPIDRPTQAVDLHQLLDVMNDPFGAPGGGPSAFATRHAALTRGLVELVEDFGLVNFSLLDIQARSEKKQSVKPAAAA